MSPPKKATMLVWGGRVYVSCANYAFSNRTIVVVVDWRMNLLNEVEVLTTRLSEDIFRPTHYKTNLKQGAHIHQPTAWQYLTHAHSHITRAVSVIWTAVSPLLGLISMA